MEHLIPFCHKKTSNLYVWLSGAVYFGGSMWSVWGAVGLFQVMWWSSSNEIFWNTSVVGLTPLSEVRLGFFPVISQVWRVNFMKGHSLWHLVPFLKAEMWTWIVCPHSRLPVLQICLNVLIASLLSSFSHFPRLSLFAFQVCRSTRMKSTTPGVSETIIVEIIEGSNKFELHFCARTGSPHTLKEEIRRDHLGLCHSWSEHWTVWRASSLNL